MTITDYLKSIRKKILFSNLNVFFWSIYVLFIALFLFSLVLENIFYLSVEVRENILFLSTFSLSSIILVYLFYIILANNDLIKNYKFTADKR